jgi:outer membrane protein assembly factor BamB
LGYQPALSKRHVSRRICEKGRHPIKSSLRSVAPLVVIETADSDPHARVICGLDGLDGHERWRFVMERDHVIPPNGLATNGDAVYAATTAGWVYALRVADGRLVWQHDVAHQALPPRYTLDLRLMAAGGIVAVDYIRPDLPVSTGRCITALDGLDGSQRWVVHDLQAVFPSLGCFCRLDSADSAAVSQPKHASTSGTKSKCVQPVSRKFSKRAYITCWRAVG